MVVHGNGRSMLRASRNVVLRRPRDTSRLRRPHQLCSAWTDVQLRETDHRPPRLHLSRRQRKETNEAPTPHGHGAGPGPRAGSPTAFPPHPRASVPRLCHIQPHPSVPSQCLHIHPIRHHTRSLPGVSKRANLVSPTYINPPPPPPPDLFSSSCRTVIMLI